MAGIDVALGGLGLTIGVAVEERKESDYYRNCTSEAAIE